MTTKTTEEKRKYLQELLQLAVELEFATIPPYLTAALSIKPNANRSSFEIIHSIYMEEMLHMVLAANTLNAIGGTVKLGPKNIPSYPLKMTFEESAFKDREFDIDLEKFCKNSIETFLKIEMPDNWEEDKSFLKAEGVDIPGYTIGEFYNLIIDELKNLCEAIGEENVFIGDPTHQIGEDFYWSSGGKPIAVTCLNQAEEALDIIIEQGEGAPGKPLSDGDHSFFGQEEEVPHFYRFNEIYWGRKYKKGDNPRKPTGEELPIDWEAVYPIKKNCKSTDFEESPLLASLNTQFNQHFTLMLQGIEKALNGNPKSLYPAIMNDMHGMAKIGYQMVQIPIHDDPESEHGAPTYEWIDLND